MNIKQLLKNYKRFKMDKKIKVSISDYWDYFWQQFNSIYFEDCQGYAHYDECYKKTKKLVDSQIET